MSGLPEWMLTPFGQGRKQQGRQDYDENYRDQYKGGEIERDGVETWWDNILRGGSDQVQKAAQDRHITRLEGTATGQYLENNRDYEITASDTDKGLRKAAIKGKGEDSAIDALVLAGYTGDTTALHGTGAAAIRAKIPGQKRATRKENYDSDPATQQLLLRQKEMDRRYYADKASDRLDRAETRRDNLELRRDNMNLEYARLAQADRQRAADRKDKAIMMLMQGLGNLGTAFTI